MASVPGPLAMRVSAQILAKSSTKTPRRATLDDANETTKTFLASMHDNPSWCYRFPYRQDFPEDHRKFSEDLIKRFLSSDYEDWVVMVIDDEDHASETIKIVAFAIWDITYVNKRKLGPGYEPKMPAQDTANAGGSSRKDADPKHLKAFRNGLVQSRDSYFAVFGQDRLNLQILATLPPFRRRGHATSLVQWGMNVAKHDKVALTLNASPQGSRLYGSLGFRALGTHKAQVPGEENYIENTAMVYDDGFQGCEDMKLPGIVVQQPLPSIPRKHSSSVCKI